MKVSTKRIYEAPARADGVRVLVDRLWPRGVSKEKARLDLWLKDIAPSTGLRKWFGHDPVKWPEFKKRYRAELKNNDAVMELRRLVKHSKHVTLLYAARDEAHNEAEVILEMIGGKRA